MRKETMPMLEAALRGGAVMLFLLLALLLLRDAWRSPARRYGGLFTLGVAAYSAISAPALAALPSPWLVPLRLVSLGNPAVLWLFAAACFDDAFEESWLRGLAWLGSVGVGTYCIFGHWPYACYVF